MQMTRWLLVPIAYYLFKNVTTCSIIFMKMNLDLILENQVI